jgi:transcriptional regulator
MGPLMPKDAALTPERAASVRDVIREALAGRPLSAHDISQRAGISEKDVAEHLEHLQRSVRAKGGRLVVKPAECLSCGYVFRDRSRVKDPGTCPKCQGSHLAASTYRIEAATGVAAKEAAKKSRRARDETDEGES